ncbi:MAG: glycosyltransferase family 4 protein [Saprospiraceae bacterium]
MDMRVLVISNYNDTFNAVRPEGELFIGLHRAGVTVDVMTDANAHYAQIFRAAGMRVIDFHPQSKFESKAVARIRQELVDGDYDILHLFNNKAIINGIRAARGLPVKVLTYRGYTGNIHWWDPSAYLTHLHPRVDAITCVSDAVKEVFDRLPFFPKGKAITVSKGHDPAWYHDIPVADRHAFGFEPQHVLVAVVANARRMKGIPWLLDAIALLPPHSQARFVLIGRGLDNPTTLRAIQQRNIADRIHFTGFRKDVLSLLQSCDISLLPSVKGEGLSKVLLESLFLGVPSIMTDIGGNRGLAIHNETGIIIPPKDAHAMAKAIEQLATDPTFRQQLGKAGQAYISTHYTVARSVQEMKAVYEKVILKLGS